MLDCLCASMRNHQFVARCVPDSHHEQLELLSMSQKGERVEYEESWVISYMRDGAVTAVHGYIKVPIVRQEPF